MAAAVRPPVDLDSTEVSVILCATITGAIATFAVILRLIIRSRMLNFLGKDDLCIVIALFFAICCSIATCFQARFALNQSESSLSGPEVGDSLLPLYISILAYGQGLTFTKISILLLYLRLFESSRTRYGCYVLLGIVIPYGAWLFFSSVFPCYPIARFLHRNIPGHCMSTPPMWYTNASINIATDVAIFALPLKTIYDLSLPKGQKISLYIVFTFGLAVCVISVVRIPTLIGAATHIDPTWDNVCLAKWSSIELNTAIFCASISTFKPLVSRFLPNILPSAETSELVQFETGGDIEGTRDVLETINETTSRSTNTASQSDTGMIYKEENFGVHEVREGVMGEIEERAMVPMAWELNDRGV